MIVGKRVNILHEKNMYDALVLDKVKVPYGNVNRHMYLVQFKDFDKTQTAIITPESITSVNEDQLEENQR